METSSLPDADTRNFSRASRIRGGCSASLRRYNAQRWRRLTWKIVPAAKACLFSRRRARRLAPSIAGGNTDQLVSQIVRSPRPSFPSWRLESDSHVLAHRLLLSLSDK